MIFQTDRLLVQKLNLLDIEAFAKMQGNPNVLRYTGSAIDTLEKSKISLNELIAAYQQENPSLLVWAIRRKADNAFIGTAALVRYDNGDQEIGYRLLEKYWGNGFGKETTNGLLKYIVEVLELKQIVAWVDVRNTASVRILEQSILTFEKEFFNEQYNSTDREYRFHKSS